MSPHGTGAYPLSDGASNDGSVTRRERLLALLYGGVSLACALGLAALLWTSGRPSLVGGAALAGWGMGAASMLRAVTRRSA